MYTLTYFEDELAEGRTEKTFDTYDEAYYAMVEQFDGAAADAGYALQPDIETGGDIRGVAVDDSDMRVVGYIGEADAHLEVSEEKWVIKESREGSYDSGADGK